MFDAGTVAAQQALEEHGRRVIEAERRQNAAAAAKAEQQQRKAAVEAETGRRDVSDVHLLTHDHERLRGRASDLPHAPIADQQQQQQQQPDAGARSSALFATIEGVTLLDDDSFELRTAGAAHLVALVSPASPRSAALLTRWAAIGERLRRVGVRTAVVDASASPRTKARFAVSAYPALLLLSADGDVTPFAGARTDDNIVEFVKLTLELAR
jgi:hypothetical protein